MIGCCSPILEGAVESTCGAATLTAHAGDFVYTPKDVAHKFTVVGDTPARLLMMGHPLSSWPTQTALLSYLLWCSSNHS